MSRRRWTWKDTVIEWAEGVAIFLAYGVAAFLIAAIVIAVIIPLLGG